MILLSSSIPLASIWFALGCGGPQIAPPAANVPVTTTDGNAAAVVAADEAWRADILRKDMDALEREVGAEFTLTTAFGVVPRPAWMANSKAWQTKAVAWREAPHVDRYADVAIVRGTLHWNVIKDKPDPRTGSAELDLDFLVTDVWVRRSGQWQIVARHSTIPLPH